MTTPESDQEVALAMLKWLRANADRDVAKRDVLELAIGKMLADRLPSILVQGKMEV